VESFLGNRSGAAFLGAFFAFCLVVLNDRRRDSKMVENIDNEIANARDLARQKSKTAENNLKSMNENRGYSGRVIAFDTALVREMKGRVLHLLDPEKRQALNAMLFRMEGIDELFDKILEGIEHLRTHAQDETRVEFDKHVEDLSKMYVEILINSRFFIDMADLYVKGNYREIITKWSAVEEVPSAVATDA
jgi:hypothetical protein